VEVADEIRLVEEVEGVVVDAAVEADEDVDEEPQLATATTQVKNGGPLLRTNAKESDRFVATVIDDEELPQSNSK